tara:strand:- start:3580 stop:3768 length:189 start_codon:yes stop_codon:yes gene_type:complete
MDKWTYQYAIQHPYRGYYAGGIGFVPTMKGALTVTLGTAEKMLATRDCLDGCVIIHVNKPYR